MQVAAVTTEVVVEAPGGEGAARVAEDLDRVAQGDEGRLRRKVVVQQAEVVLALTRASRLIEQLVAERSGDAAAEVLEKHARYVGRHRRLRDRVVFAAPAERGVVSGLGRHQLLRAGVVRGFPEVLG